MRAMISARRVPPRWVYNVSAHAFTPASVFFDRDSTACLWTFSRFYRMTEEDVFVGDLCQNHSKAN